MHFLFDNLSAQIIAAGMLLMLLSVNVRNQRAVTEVTHFYTMRKQQIAFVDIIKRDMRNVTEVLSLTESAADSSFRFRALSSPGSNVVTEIAYRRTRTRRADGTDYYRIDRYVDGVRAGGSMSTLVNWEITACNAQGMPVAAAENAREIVIRFEAKNPYRKTDMERDQESDVRARWEGAFRPPRIQQIENI